MVLNCVSYSQAPEIFQYFKSVAEKYELYKYILLRHKVVEAKWSEDEAKWNLKIENLDNNEVFEDWCDFLINGGGILK